MQGGTAGKEGERGGGYISEKVKRGGEGGRVGGGGGRGGGGEEEI